LRGKPSAKRIVESDSRSNPYIIFSPPTATRDAIVSRVAFLIWENRSSADGMSCPPPAGAGSIPGRVDSHPASSPLEDNNLDGSLMNRTVRHSVCVAVTWIVRLERTQVMEDIHNADQHWLKQPLPEGRSIRITTRHRPYRLRRVILLIPLTWRKMPVNEPGSGGNTGLRLPAAGNRATLLNGG